MWETRFERSEELGSFFCLCDRWGTAGQGKLERAMVFVRATGSDGFLSTWEIRGRVFSGKTPEFLGGIVPA